MTWDGYSLYVTTPSGKRIECRNAAEARRVEAWVIWLKARIEARHLRELREEALPRLAQFRRTPW